MDPHQIDLSPLTRFRLLEQLQLTIRAAVSLIPKFVQHIPYSWPQLRCLFLCHQFTTSRPPSIDHTDVIRLVRGLPALQDLGIPFDATTIMEREARPALPQPRLRTLRVGRSPICSPSRAVHFLLSNFPILETLDITYLPRPGEDTLYKRRWECVLRDWKAARVL